MKFICLMGITGSGKSTIEQKLEGLGYTRSISYTTREPQVRNGELEINGREYRFVTKEKFMDLVNKGMIIEYEQYGENYYGTPEPFGSTRYVAVVCINGFKTLKERYGDQILGVYLKVDKQTAINRAKSRDKTEEQVLRRLTRDLEVATEMENIADIVVDANKDTVDIIAEILTEIKNRSENRC